MITPLKDNSKYIVLVSLTSYNKVPWARWIISNKNLFSTVLVAGSQRLGCQLGWVLVAEPSSGFADCELLIVSSDGKKSKLSDLL